jgi:hypothetical protein
MHATDDDGMMETVHTSSSGNQYTFLDRAAIIISGND